MEEKRSGGTGLSDQPNNETAPYIHTCPIFLLQKKFIGCFDHINTVWKTSLQILSCIMKQNF